MLRKLFSLKCMTTTSGGIYIYSFLFSILLIKWKTKKYHTVGTILKSNILNDLEQLLEHTQVSKHSIGFKWRSRGCIVCFYKTIIFTVYRWQYYFLVLLLHCTAHLLLYNVVSSTPRLSGIRYTFVFLKYWSLVIKQQSLNQKMKLIINKFYMPFQYLPHVFTFFNLFLLSF
jgi:hypothetical protein